MRRTWTNEQITFLTEKYPTTTTTELQESLPDKTLSAIKSKARILKLKRDIPRFRFTPDQLLELKAIFPTTPSAEIATKFGCSNSALSFKARKMGLKKDPAYLREVMRKQLLNPDHPGRKHQFTKGQVPMNKGKKQTEYMSTEAIEKCKGTRFKKGDRAKNMKPIGYSYINRDGYISVKVADPKTFDVLHRIVWRQHNGEIPRGHNVQFKDGDRQNCSIENLYLISKQEQMVQNSSSTRLSDGIIAMWIVGKRGKDKELIAKIKEHPELLELKRSQIILNRNIKSHGTKPATRRDDR